MNKQSLRKQVLARRLAMSASEIQAKSALVSNYVINELVWDKINSAHIYKSRGDWKEVDTHDLVHQLTAAWPKLKITQPGNSHGEPIPPQKFDLIIVPCLAFDSRGNRLGWGGGWYDRFLARQPQAVKIGLCFESGRLDAIPVEPHDMRLDKIITEV